MKRDPKSPPYRTLADIAADIPAMPARSKLNVKRALAISILIAAAEGVILILSFAAVRSGGSVWEPLGIFHGVGLGIAAVGWALSFLIDQSVGT